MRKVNLHFAKTHLSRLVDEALGGEEVVIARDGTALVKLTPVEASGKRRVLGKDQGKIVIAEDFDAPMPEIEALFYGDDTDPP
ncbi:MAG TPA: type II toxin-antitoxin system prevent-host-death family antitoxin [Thermoanaerobaculia bacterium]|nr:type II toxin-antitoxin system prevent-host-death family antitoxin [Thermoanaerobaculia bacterium]